MAIRVLIHTALADPAVNNVQTVTFSADICLGDINTLAFSSSVIFCASCFS